MLDSPHLKISEKNKFKKKLSTIWVLVLEQNFQHYLICLQLYFLLCYACVQFCLIYFGAHLSSFHFLQNKRCNLILLRNNKTILKIVNLEIGMKSFIKPTSITKKCKEEKIISIFNRYIL